MMSEEEQRVGDNNNWTMTHVKEFYILCGGARDNLLAWRQAIRNVPLALNRV